MCINVRRIEEDAKSNEKIAESGEQRHRVRVTTFQNIHETA